MTAQDQIEFDWTTPDRFPHRHLWIWDSAFHALGLRHIAPEWAKNAIKSVLSKQRPDGFIPHMMTPDGVHDSHIIQPPIMAWGTWRVYESCGDTDFIRYCYPRLKAMILYNCREKDRDGNGLAEWEEGGSSGMDNSPRFDQPWGDSVDLNSYLVNDMFYLAEMARLLGIPDDVDMWTRLRGERCKKINDLMWDDSTGFYYDLDPQGRRIMLKTEAGFTPIFAGICSEEQAASLVKHLESPDEFWRAFPLPSVSADEPTFSDDMWRGPVWINFNCFLIEALKHYGYADTASRLRDITLGEIARWYESDGVIYEFYDSEGNRSPSILNRKGDKGIPFGRWHIGRCIRDYHFTAAIFIDLLMCDSTQL